MDKPSKVANIFSQYLKLNNKSLPTSKSRSNKKPHPLEKQETLGNLVIGSSKNPKEQVRYLANSDFITEDEAYVIFLHIRNNKFFRQYLKGNEDYDEIEPFINLCKRIKYKKCFAGQVIMKQGEVSDGRVYLVMTGTLSVLVKNADFLEESAALNAGDEPQKSPKSSSGRNSKSPRDKDARHPTQFQQQDSIVIDHKPKPIQLIREYSKNDLGPGASSPVKKHSQIEILNQVIKEESQKHTGTESPKNHNKELTIPSPSNSSVKIGLFRKSVQSLISMMNSPDKRNSSLFSFGTRSGGSTPANKSSVELTLTEYGVVKDQITEEGFFGERAPMGRRRKATIVAMDEAELLYFEQKDYEEIKEKFDKTKKQFEQFLINCFNICEETNLLEALLHIMEVKDFERGQKLAQQGKQGDEIFLLYEGECELLKEVTYDNSNVKFASSAIKNLYGLSKTSREEFILCNISSGSFFGLEILFNEHSEYELTLKTVSKNCTFLVFNKSKMFMRCPHEVFYDLKKIYLQYQNKNHNLLKSRLQTKGIESDVAQLVKSKPVIILPEKKSSLNHYVQGSETPTPTPTPTVKKSQKITIKLPSAPEKMTPIKAIKPLNDFEYLLQTPQNSSPLDLLKFDRTPSNTKFDRTPSHVETPNLTVRRSSSICFTPIMKRRDSVLEGHFFEKGLVSPIAYSKSPTNHSVSELLILKHTSSKRSDADSPIHADTPMQRKENPETTSRSKRFVGEIDVLRKQIHHSRISSVDNSRVMESSFRKVQELNETFTTYLNTMKEKYTFVDQVLNKEKYQFTNKIENFRLGLGKTYAEVQKRYAKEKKAQSCANTPERSPNRSIYAMENGQGDLADYLQIRLLDPKYRLRHKIAMLRAESSPQAKTMSNQELKELIAQYPTMNPKTPAKSKSRQMSPKSTTGGFTFKGTSRKNVEKSIRNLKSRSQSTANISQNTSTLTLFPDCKNYSIIGESTLDSSKYTLRPPSELKRWSATPKHGTPKNLLRERRRMASP